MITKQLQKIKHYHSRMTTAINELTQLENMEEMQDYNDVILEMKSIVRILEERREWLQKHGRTQ